MAELWYSIKELPDLTLNKYSSLEENGVDGVLEKHSAFLRQLNRMGLVSHLSFHLYYLYLVPSDPAKDRPGNRLRIFLQIRGREDELKNVPALMKASPLSAFFVFRSRERAADGAFTDCSISSVLANDGVAVPTFNTCSFLTKTETLLPAGSGEEEYYLLREWEMNEAGRLYGMCNMMEALNRTALYRVDLYPVERSVSLRETLRKPMGVLRKRQEDYAGTSRDYNGKDVLDNYEKLLEQYDSSPHFIANIMVFAGSREDAASILDAAGSESLLKGKYTISTFCSDFRVDSFLDGRAAPLENVREGAVLRPGKPGLIICGENTRSINLNYLPGLFTLEETAPFFRFPALYDGEIIQMPKETAPAAVAKEGALFLGRDKNGYDIYFPPKLLPKHAFISGVPGSGKTNTMHHITSSLWKEHGIPFLVLEPAKREYRALANDPGMKDLYLFSPNADMSFPLHINPFEMPRGTLVAEHIRQLCSVFEGAFPLEPPMPFLLDTAIEAVYRELGWIPDHIYTGEELEKNSEKKRPLPTLSMLYRRLEQELRTTQYSDEVRGNLESALKVRIGSLLRREMGDVFDVPSSTFEPEKWLQVPAVIELESMGAGPANFLTLMLCSLIRETLRVQPRFDGAVRHVIFIEEAHNLIGPVSEAQPGADADPKQAATAFVVKMLAEVRALKEGIVIADQLPTVMAQEVLKNTGLKLGLRITSADDRSLLGSTMAASALQLEQMSTFEVGEALIFYEGLKRPFTMRIKEWCGEIEDKSRKAARVTPRNDAELRHRLARRETYRETNLRSIELTGKKYFRRLSDLDVKIAQSTNWLKAVRDQYNAIRKLNRMLEQIAQGGKAVSEEEKSELYDQWFLLQNSYEAAAKDREAIREPVSVLETLGDWIYTLERLKNGRWARFGAPDEAVFPITLLQSKLCDTVKSLYTLMAEALPSVTAVSGMKDDIRELTALSEQFNEDMRAYVARHGAADPAAK